MSNLKVIGVASALGLVTWGCGPRSELECLKEAAEIAKTNIAFKTLRTACEKEFPSPSTPENLATAGNEALATEAQVNNVSFTIDRGVQTAN